MKITIDTKEDSHDELRKVIRMLSSLVGKEVMSNEGDIFKDDKDDNNQPETSDAFNMFNNPQPENQTEEEPKEEKKDEIDLGIPGVEEYE